MFASQGLWEASDKPKQSFAQNFGMIVPKREERMQASLGRSVATYTNAANIKR